MNSNTRRARRGILWLALGIALGVSARPVSAADLIGEARALYNRGQYEQAIALALKVRATGKQVDAANLVLARASLERFRQSADRAHLDQSREAINAVRAEALGTRERIECLVGFGELLFLDEAYGAAAEVFGAVMARSSEAGPATHERVVDWWASALERRAQERSADDRLQTYRRILLQMELELTREPTSAAAAYWQVVALRGSGDMERAWAAAVAGWVRARLTTGAGAALRADLDRFVLQALVPDRARLGGAPDARRAQVADDLRQEWERVKERWK